MLTIEEHGQLESLIEKAEVGDIIEAIIRNKKQSFLVFISGDKYHYRRNYGDENRIIAEMELLKLKLLGVEI